MNYDKIINLLPNLDFLKWKTRRDLTEKLEIDFEKKFFNYLQSEVRAIYKSDFICHNRKRKDDLVIAQILGMIGRFI